jgi:Cutinase
MAAHAARSRRTAARLFAAAITFASSAAVVTGVAGSPQPAAAAGASCTPVILLGERGSGELASDGLAHAEMPSDLGLPVYALFVQLSRLRPHIVSALAIDYDAAPVTKLIPSKSEVASFLALSAAGTAVYYAHHNVKGYLASVQDGVNLGMIALRDVAARCPASRFVLAGYSQGAMAWHEALEKIGAGWHPGLLGRVAAVALIADPDALPTSAEQHVGTAKITHQGLTHNHTDVPSVVVNSTYSLCDTGDIVCDFSLPHYLVGGAPAFIVSRFSDAVDVHEHTYASYADGAKGAALAGRTVAVAAQRIALHLAVPATAPQIDVPAITEPTGPGVSSHLYIVPGQHLYVSASGTAGYGYEGAEGCVGFPVVTPEGDRSVDGVDCGPKIDPNAPVTTVGIGALIAKVGDGPWFYPLLPGGVRATTAGLVSFGFNDQYAPDDSGSYTVTASVS